MTRSMASAREAGARFERLVADYLARHVDDRIDRRVKTGARDKGDIAGLRHMGGRVVIEAKDYGGRLLTGVWLREVEIERGNDDAIVGALVVKRRAVAHAGDQVVVMTLRDLVALLTGERPDD